MPLSTWTSPQVINQLNSNFLWSGSTITYAFPTTTAGLTANYGESASFSAFAAQQKAMATIALGIWDDIIAPDMALTTASSSNIEFANFYDGSFGDYAHAYLPTDGTVWMNSAFSGAGSPSSNDANNNLMNPVIGKHGFSTFVHEIGHTLGLEHAGNYPIPNVPDAPSNFRDSTVYSIMSYFGPSWGSQGEPTLVAWADWVGADNKLYEPQTAMIDDILALQAMYGVETTTRLGSTVYGFNSTLGGVSGGIYDFTLNLNPILCLFDSGGLDSLDVSGWSTQSLIDLNEGAFSSCNSMTSNISIAYGVLIENASTGGGNDTLTGNSASNTLNGGLGNDTFIGGAGADQLNGQGGNDTASYAGSAAGVTVNLNLATAQVSAGDASGDVLSAIANLIGSSQADTLTGNSSANILNGGLGDDTLIGSGGADQLVGGGGNDTASYAGSAAGVTVNLSLATAQVSAGDASGDVLSAIANLIGSSGADTLTGNSAANILRGGAGNDTLNGDAGSDTAVFTGNISGYAFSKSGETYTVYNPDSSMDTVTGVEFFQFDSGTVAATSLPLTGMPQRQVTIVNAVSSQSEGNSGTTIYSFEIQLNASPYTSQTISWSVAGNGVAAANAADFSGALSGSVTFAPGETSKIVQVAVVGDTTVEASETFGFTLSAPTSGLAISTASATATIVNDDIAVRTVSVAAVTASASEGNNGSIPFAFNITLDQASTATQSVSYNVNGTGPSPTSAGDFSGALSGTVTFAPGETTKQIIINALGDTVVEANETFAFNLSSPTAGLNIGTASAQSTILNDDSNIRQVSIAAATPTLAEGNAGTTAFTFTVSLNGPATSAQSVSYRVAGTGTQAASAADFVGGNIGQVTFAAGETSKTVTVQVATNTIAEANETFDVSLFSASSGLTLGTAAALASITNDDTINLTTTLAADISLTASGIYGGYGTANLLDDNISTFAATPNGADEWFKLDLGSTNLITDVVLKNRDAAGERLNGAVVKLLDANGVVVHTFAAIANATDGQLITLHLDQPIAAYSVYIDGAPGQFIQLAEIDIMGTVGNYVNITDVASARISITASSIYGGYAPGLLLDNNLTSFAATSNGPAEWVKLDLGAADRITDIVISNRDAAGFRLDGTIVQILSSTGAVLHEFAAVSGAADSEIFNFHLDTPLAASAIRILGAPNQFLQIAEIDVFGFAAAPNLGVNLTETLSGQLSVTSSSNYGGYGNANLLDNNKNTFTATGNGADEWLKFNLGGAHDILSIELTNRDAAGFRLNGTTVLLLDTSNNVVYSFDPIVNAQDGQILRFTLDTAVNATSIYIDGAPNQFIQLSEVDIFGVA
jgi:Ca2+-binding RTX toxin-like protein